MPFAVDELAVVARVLGVAVETLLPHLDSNQKPIGIQSGGQLVLPFRRLGVGTTTVAREQLLADVIDLDSRRAS